MKKAVLKIGNRQIVVVKSENGYAFAGVENDAFKEADHPRDKGGKFTSKGGAGSGSGSKENKPAEKKIEWDEKGGSFTKKYPNGVSGFVNKIWNPDYRKYEYHWHADNGFEKEDGVCSDEKQAKENADKQISKFLQEIDSKGMDIVKKEAKERYLYSAKRDLQRAGVRGSEIDEILKTKENQFEERYKKKPAEKKEPENKESIEKAKNILRKLEPIDLEPPSREAKDRMEGTGASADMRLPMLWIFKDKAKKAVEKALNEEKDVQVEVAESIRGFVIEASKNVDKMPPHERKYVRDILNEITEMTYKLKNRYDR